MRVLVACGACRRQYDAANLPVGSRFRCACGELLRVPRVKAREAAVVRCSSCGGPRGSTEAVCRFCNAAFTAHEQDMATICANCMARVSDSARFCHHCGLPIVPEGDAGRGTDRCCPACDGRHRLNSRQIGGQPLAVLECPYCAGLWLAHESLRLAVERAREKESVDSGPPRPRTGPADDPARRVTYRRCPECDKAMHRRNWGRKSGVIVDSCREHGVWFDAHELDRILRWVRDGGEAAVRASDAAEERHRQRLERYERELPGAGPEPSRPENGAAGSGGLLDDLVRAVLGV